MDFIKQVGTRFDDTLIGTDRDDKLLGKKGNDLLFGRAGNDRLQGNAGNDELFGEAGDDILRGGKGNDFLDGGAGNDHLNGGKGDDVLYSSAGVDRLLGRAGNDIFKISAFEAGYFIDGGRENNDGDANEAGNALTGDTLDLSELDLTDVSRVFVDLDLENQGALNPVPPTQNGILRIDREGTTIEIEVKDVENIIGSSFGETLFGNQENNQIFGGAGDDRIHPFGGVDFVDGGDGIDTFLLNAAPQGVSIDFELGIAGPNTFVNFENANGSSTGSDTILGDAGANVLNGLGGDDALNGRGGGDTLEGGAGRDRFVFDGDPFDGVDVSAAGRQIVGNEDFIVDFSIADDRFVLNSEDFEVSGDVSFFNGLAEDLPTGGVNVIALQNSDNDNNPNTPFLAGTAANLIAERIDEAGAGFFVYFNSNLGLNRLVYSTDLSDANADLKCDSFSRNLVRGGWLASLR